MGHLFLKPSHHAVKKVRNHIESPYVSAENPTEVSADSTNCQEVKLQMVLATTTESVPASSYSTT